MDLGIATCECTCDDGYFLNEQGVCQQSSSSGDGSSSDEPKVYEETIKRKDGYLDGLPLNQCAVVYIK